MQELPKQSMIGDPIPTFRCADDRAARPHDLGCRAHTFYRLIKVQVQRISRICGQHNIKRLINRHHGGGTDLLNAPRVRLIEVSSEDAGDRFLVVQGCIDQEVRTG